MSNVTDVLASRYWPTAAPYRALGLPVPPDCPTCDARRVPLIADGDPDTQEQP